MKFTKPFLIAILSAFAGSATFAQKPVLLEKVEKKPGELVIPYEKWQLSNGLTLVISEDHSDPIVNVEVTYHVGSSREVKDRSGFAHFFEHMMFQGSLHVKDEEHFKIVQEAGGTMNGTTNRDRTNYFETLPKNQLEVALWLEADRMGFLLDSVTQRKFEVQRSTVKNEKGQNFDNRPYGMIGEINDKTLYPVGHPYSWTTIGVLEDLDRANVDDLKNFFLRWYGPNNATLVVVGDVNPSDVVALCDKYFGPIPRGPEVKKMKVDPVVLPDNRYANYPDNIVFPMSQFTFPGVPSYHADEPALDLLMDILCNGNNSWLYQTFDKQEKAVFSGGTNGCYELAGEIKFQIFAYPGADLGATEKDFYAMLSEFEKKGVSDDDLIRAKSKLQSGLYNVLESVRGKSSFLSTWLYLLPNRTWNMNNEIDRYKKVTKEDLMRVYTKYIKGKGACVVNFVPGGKNENKTEVKVSDLPPVVIPDEYKGLVYKRPVDTFDRSKKPVAGPAPNVTLPVYYQDQFANGIKIIGNQNSEIPKVTLLISMDGGNMLDQYDLSKMGLAGLTAEMLNEGTTTKTSEQFSAELEKLGSSISFGAGDEDHTISVTSMVSNLDATLKLLEEKLFHPKFDEEDLKRLKNQTIQGIRSQEKDASAMADVAFSRIVFGNNVLGISPTEKNIKSITLADVQKFYETYYTPSHCKVVIVGDITKEQILPKLDFLKNWGAKDYKLPDIGDELETGPTTIYLIDKFEAPQSQIRFGYIAMPYDATGDFFKARITNFPFGGNFNSRINLNLREDKGFTYGVSGGFTGSKTSGFYSISCGVRASSTDTSVSELYKEMQKYAKDGITEEELQFTKNSISGGDALKYETSGQKAGFLNRIISYNLPSDFTAQQEQVLKTITKNDIDKLAAKYFNTNNVAIVVVGDKKLLKKRLEDLKIGKVVVVSDYTNPPVETKGRTKISNKTSTGKF